MILRPYAVPKQLPPLAPSRVRTLERIIRIIEGDTNKHLAIEGKPGIGRRTLLHHLFHLSPSLKRNDRLTLDVHACASELYEPADTTAFFQDLDGIVRQHTRGLIMIDPVASLLDTSDKSEERRLSRFLDFLVRQANIRCVFPVEPTMAVRIKGTPALHRHIATVPIEQLTVKELQDILGAHQIPQADEFLKLAQRFLHHEAAPGNAIRLWRAAERLATQQSTTPTLTHAHQHISEERGIPLEAVSGSATPALQTLAADIQTELIGQDHAVIAVTKTLTRAYAGFRNDMKPIASFLFLGPSGVGKTELAKILSRRLYQSQSSFHRIDMSEFAESHTVHRLIGAPPGYVGFEEGGQLTNPVEQDPYSLVLLDEIEKAHPKVFDVFLQLLDDGRLTDGRGKTVDFTHTTIVATSNIGLREIVESSKDGTLHDREKFLSTKLLPLLLTHFRPEFLNRFDAIVVFEPLKPETLAVIGTADIQKLQQKLAKQRIALTVKPETLAAMSRKAYQPTFGARPMKRLVEQQIESEIAERIVRQTLRPGDAITF